MWNGPRIIGLSTNEILWQFTLAHLAPEVGLNAETTLQATDRMAIDCIEAAPRILAVSRASMSQSLLREEVRVCRDAQLASFGCFAQLCPDGQKMPYLQWCLLQWLILFAAEMDCIRPRTRSCTLCILDQVGNAMQMQQWTILADCMRPQIVQNQSNWNV